MVVIEEVKQASGTNSDTDDDMPTLEEEDELEQGGEEKREGNKTEEGEEVEGGGGRTKHSRNEKKARNVLTKLGMQPVSDVLCVRLRKNRQISFIITNPEVFKSATSDTYVIFGDAKMEDSNETAEKMFAQKRNAYNEAGTHLARGVDSQKQKEDGENEQKQKIEFVKDEEIDEKENDDATVIEEKDINIVMAQTLCTRNKAIATLKKHNCDVVEAIMHLTS